MEFYKKMHKIDRGGNATAIIFHLQKHQFLYKIIQFPYKMTDQRVARSERPAARAVRGGKDLLVPVRLCLDFDGRLANQ